MYTVSNITHRPYTICNSKSTFISVFTIKSRCMSKNRLYTKMLRIHLFSIFTIKTPRTLAALAPLVLLIVKTLTNVL